MKILGGLCIILGCFGIGKSYCKGLKERYENLRELLECIGILEGEIRYANKPLAEVFEGIHKKRQSVLGTLFLQVAEELKQMRGSPFLQIWKEQIKLYENKVLLQKEDWEELENFGRTLGIMDVTMQMQQVELYAGRLKGSIGEAKEQWREKERLVPKFGMVCGMVLVLILI